MTVIIDINSNDPNDGELPGTVEEAIETAKPLPTRVSEAYPERSSIPLYQAKGKVTITVWPLQVKMKIQITPDVTKEGLDLPIHTERTHTATVNGAVIPPFILNGPVPKSNYSIRQNGASATISLKWNDITTKLTTIALPYNKLTNYAANSNKDRTYALTGYRQ